MKTIKLFFALLACGIFAACATTQAPNSPRNVNSRSNSTANTVGVSSSQNSNPVDSAKNDLAAAKDTFTKFCIRCHQENGEGGNNIQIGDLTIKHVPNFNDPKIAAEPDAEYIATIENGASEGMPKFKGRLSPEQIQNLVRFIRAEFQGKTQ